jgi:Flp pilus assembly protein TadD
MMSDAEQNVTQAWDHLREGRTDQALSAFETTLRSHPEDVDAHYGLGLTQQRLKHRDDAVETFSKALALLAEQQKLVIRNEAQTRDNMRTPEEDRYMMLSRMVQQRLDELNASS